MLRIASISLTTLAFSGAAMGHHSFGEFDMRRDVEVTGSVTGLDFVNPHSYIYLEVVTADGSVAAYRCEMRSATALRRSGWMPELFPNGERLTILGSPSKEDPHSCYVGSIRFDDGSTLDRYGQRTPAAPAQSTERPLRLANGDLNISGDWAPEQFVMTDPRGQSGTLVPLSIADSFAPGEVPEGQQPIPGARNSEMATNEPVDVPLPVEYTEAGRRAAAAFDVLSTQNPRMRCEPTSILDDWAFDAAINRITQAENVITLEYGQFGLRRTIHMNQSEHPAQIETSRAGHSIGRWEDNELIVDTVGFEPGVLAIRFDAGVLTPILHSDQLRVVERFTLDADRVALTRSYVAEDPEFFVGQYSGSDTVHISNVPFTQIPCRELSREATATAEQQSEQEAAERPWWRFWN